MKDNCWNIDWNGASYPVKELTIHVDDHEETVLVSVERLLRQLEQDRGNWSYREAEVVDSEIYFYLDDETFNLPDEEIIKYLEAQE